LFVEHGHRQLGAIVGMITIVLVITTWWRDARWWVRVFALTCLLAVIGQGVLGGVRVLREDTRLAMVHGCTGPMFFCMTVAMAAVTSRWWREADQRAKTDATTSTRSLVPLAWIVVALAAGQLVLGAQLRHAQAGNPPGVFRTMVVFHLIGALLVALHVVLLAVRTLRTENAGPLLRRPATGLLIQVTLQILLGLGTWVVKYNFPTWAQTAGLTTGFTVSTGSFWQASIITGHVAIGSLLLATSFLFALRATRLEYSQRVTVAASSAATSSMLWSLL
jgi:cytochrome c oxidase assembly protein subunit 15